MYIGKGLNLKFGIVLLPMLIKITVYLQIVAPMPFIKQTRK